jgi:hypothetical protein
MEKCFLWGSSHCLPFILNALTCCENLHNQSFFPCRACRVIKFHKLKGTCVNTLMFYLIQSQQSYLLIDMKRRNRSSRGISHKWRRSAETFLVRRRFTTLNKLYLVPSQWQPRPSFWHFSVVFRVSRTLCLVIRLSTTTNFHGFPQQRPWKCRNIILSRPRQFSYT